jgi:hypothetical protein
MKEKEENNDMLSKYLGEQTDNISSRGSEKKMVTPAPKSDLEYINVDLNALPLGMFYQTGTKIKIRSARVSEVQAYSVVDNSNYVDVTEKMNQMLSSCVKYIYPNGMVGSYKDIRDGDRLFLIFMIRELTFQRGNSLAKDVKCPYCSNEFKIQFRSTPGKDSPRTMRFYETDERLAKYYKDDLKCFELIIDGASYKIAPPTIGIQELFFQDIKTKVQLDKNLNVSFLKIIPYLLWDRTYISEDGIKAKEDEFKRMDMFSFQVLTQAVDKMIFGIKELFKKCPECGQEVHTDMTFPERASALFVVPDFFDEFDKK